MSGTSDLGRRPGLAIGSVLLANLLPLVGVLWLGWDATVLVVIYGLELLVTFPLAGLKALFAQRPPRTDQDDSSVISVSYELTAARGSVDLVSWLPPVYPRNLPFATAVGNGAMWCLIGFGIVLANVVTVGEVLARPEVLLSALALVVAQSVDTWREYLREGYKTASAYSVIETPARQAFFLAFVLMVTPGVGIVGVEGILAVVVGGKLLIEWSAYRATAEGSSRLTDWLAGPEPVESDPDPVEVPDVDSNVRISTDGRAVMYAAVFDVIGRHAPFLAMPFVFVWFVTPTVLGEGAGPLVVVGVSAGLAVLYVGSLGLRVLMTYLQYGFIEYRQYADRIVAYDTLLDEPQWSTTVSTLRDVELVPDRLADRLQGTRTFTVTTGWGDHETRRYLGPTADPEGLIEAFELPVSTTELAPLDRRPAAVVVACLCVLGAAVVGLAVGPWIALADLLFSGVVYGVFGLPFLWLVLRGIWVQSYPDRTTDPDKNTIR